jgi:hypothetical protein
MNVFNHSMGIFFAFQYGSGGLGGSRSMDIFSGKLRRTGGRMYRAPELFLQAWEPASSQTYARVAE